MKIVSVMGDDAELILASASQGRAELLRNAGLHFRQCPADIDERRLQADAVQERGPLDAGELALMLAAAKAQAVSRAVPDALIIGADQMMECGGTLFEKPPTMEAARGQLRQLRGRAHCLHSAVCVAQDGEMIWRHLAKAELEMRDFSDGFLDDYCRLEGEILLQSVGAYRIEGLGVQLFSRIEGDIFTIIGLPLLPLLGYFRKIGRLAH
jgi:septum formation protein